MSPQLEAYQKAAEQRLSFRSRAGNDHNYACPFCERDGATGELHVHWTKAGAGAAICHQCGYRARQVRILVRDLFGGALPLSIKWLPVPDNVVQTVNTMLVRKGEDAQPVPLPDSFRRLRPREKCPVAAKVLRYLRGRGLSDDDIEAFNVGWLDDPSHRAFGYAVFPFSVNGRVVYWQGRRVIGDGPKTYNPSGTDKQSLVYGFDQAADAHTLFVCEGPLDAIAWGPGGIALTGKYIRPGMVRAIRCLPARRVIVCGDPDAEREWDAVYTSLASGAKTRMARLRLAVEDEDPAAIGRRELHERARRLRFTRSGVRSLVREILK